MSRPTAYSRGDAILFSYWFLTLDSVLFAWALSVLVYYTARIRSPLQYIDRHKVAIVYIAVVELIAVFIASTVRISGMIGRYHKGEDRAPIARAKNIFLTRGVFILILLAALIVNSSLEKPASAYLSETSLTQNL